MTRPHASSVGSLLLLLGLAVLLPFTRAFVPLTPPAASSLSLRSSSSRLLRRPSAVGGGGNGDKEGGSGQSSQGSQRRQRLLEDTMFSLETRAQQLAREAEQRRRMKEEGAAGEGEVAALAATQAQAGNDDDDDEEEGRELVGREYTDAVLWELEWLPFNIRQALARSSGAMTRADLATLREEVFGLDSFYVTGEDWAGFPKAVLFRGNLRGDSLADGMAHVRAAMENMPGLASRVSLFLIELPQERVNDVVEYGLMAAPAKDLAPTEILAAAPLISLACLGASGVSALAFAYGAFLGNPEFFDTAPAILAHILPVAGGILGIQVIHELAHIFVGRTHGLKLSWPLFLPSMEMGLFGAITPLASFPKDRKSLFDTALAGPLAGLAASILLFLLGLHMTPPVFIPEHAVSDASLLSGAAADALAQLQGPQGQHAMASVDLPLVPASLIHQSFLLSTLSAALLPHLSLVGASDAPVALHPLALVGLCGAIASAFTCLPVGRLDGGRAFAAAFGPRRAGRVGVLVLLGQAALCLLSGSGLPLLFLWGMILISLQKRLEVAPMDDITEVDEGRQAVLLATLFCVLITILPYPH